MRTRILLILLTFVLPLVAKDKPFDKEQYKRASIRYDEVTGTGDPAAIRALADSLHEAGHTTGNYAIALLYYDAMAFYYYYNGGDEEEVAKQIVDNYAEGMKEAEESGSESIYWKFYYAKVINYIEINSMECLEQVESMLQEVSKNHSDYAMIRVYHTLSYIYIYRNERMMAIDILKEAVKLGENNTSGNEENISRALCDLIYLSLIECYYQLPLYDDALAMTDKLERYLNTSKVFSEEEKRWRMRDVYAMRAYIYFDQWKYDEFDKQIALLKADPTYNSYIMSPDQFQLRFYTLLRDGKEADLQEMMESLPESEIHSFKYFYFKYRNRMREAIHEYETNMLYLDSITYRVRGKDMASIDARMGNVQLREEKLRLEAQQFKIKAWATGGLLLVIMISISIMLIRHRRHAKQLMEKNVQLSLARDEAEKQRAEAVEQRGIAEEQKAEAETQRAIAEEQKAEAETQRAIAEEQKAEAETQRAIAEEQRAEAIEQRTIAFEQRAIAEEQREEAERQRAEAENQRTEAERQRSIAEEQRSIAEEQKAEAEVQRAEAEAQRAEAEAQKAEAETQKGIAEEQRGIAVKAQKVAEQANEMKGKFILSMMHEIRTPLNHIKGFSTILTDPNMQGEPEMMQEASTQINNSTNHLTHLLDDILQLGKFDGMVDVEKTDASAVELLLTAMMNSPQADPSSVEMIPAIEDADPCLTIPTNMEMAQKAYAALINNAVKFTKQGYIKLGIDTTSEDEVRFYVEDTGPGIPAGQEEYIFERFVKLDEFVPGTGLGLSLSDAITKALGGRVYVDTTYEGPGARFVMALPK